ncbi:MULTISPECIES: GNAT family N-acetyltransferase [Nonomuraea]|uniref:GNAT family N-acetyltransferase n=1 Tax=Nonomuraea mangrovi TaxID=2316207 RepID=A0ABW4SR08_9ACTN
MNVESVAWDDPAAVRLREAMSKEMGERYADMGDFDFPEDFSVSPESVVYTGVAITAGGVPVGHVALRRLGADLEIKRMFVAPEHRGNGVATALLEAAEGAAARLGAGRVVLQTGDRQPDAVRLYEREGYTPIAVYPPYHLVPNSLCYMKHVT